MPLKAGYSGDVVRENIRTEMAHGKPREQAVAVAFASARAYFKRQHPGKELPSWLSTSMARASGATSQGAMQEAKLRGYRG